MKTWHYGTGGGGQAQTDEENLKELVESGAIRPGTPIWSNGMASWEAASKVMPELFQGPGTPRGRARH